MPQHCRGWTEGFLGECPPVLLVSWRVFDIFRLEHTVLNRSSTWFGQCRINVSLRVPTALNSTTDICWLGLAGHIVVWVLFCARADLSAGVSVSICCLFTFMHYPRVPYSAGRVNEENDKRMKYGRVCVVQAATRILPHMLLPLEAVRGSCISMQDSHP
jgi:hypothetical protein